MVAWTSINRVYWYESTMNLTVDTISVVVTQYNNTAITTSDTVFGNVGSVDPSTVAEAQSLLKTIVGDGEADPHYAATPVQFGNPTWKVDGSVTIPYPTPYLAIDGFEYVSITTRIDGCPPAQTKGLNDTCTCILDTLLFAFVDQGVGFPPQGWGPGEFYPSQSTVIVPLTATYYEAMALKTLNLSNAQDFFADMDSNTGILNTASFLNFLSAASIFESYPALSSCAIVNTFNGPPAVMIPASVLTSTVTTTTAGAGRYDPPTPKPASPVKVTIIPQTAEVPLPTPTISAAQSPEAPSPDSPETPENPPDLPVVQPIAGPSVTAGQQLPVPVVGASTQILGGVTPAQGISILNQGAPNLVQSLPVLTVDGSTYQADQATHFVIAGQTVEPGGTITVSGTPIAIDADASVAVIGSSTQSLSNKAVTSKPILIFAGTTYTADDSANFAIAGDVLTKGGTIVVDGTQLSYDEAGTDVVIGTSTQMLAPPGTITAVEPVLTFGESTYTADPSSDFILNGQTLTKGGSITVDGTQLSYDEAGTGVVIGTSTQILSHAAITAAVEPILSFDGSTFIADSSSNFVIDGQTLSKGDVITVDGTRLSYDQAGTDVAIGSSTQRLSTTTIAAAQEPAITFDGSTYYANPSSDFIIDGQTLTKGGVITVQGTPVSYAIAGTDVVVGTSTEAVGLGGYILSGFGGGPSPTGVSVQFTGKAARRFPASWILRLTLGLLTVYFGL